MSSRPRRNLPNQGDSQADKDYICYDRDSTDKSTSLLLENNEDMKLKEEKINSMNETEQPNPANEIIITKSDSDKMEAADPGTDSKKISTPTKLSITPTATNNKIESRVKTVVARDKATGKKVLMKLMPVGAGGAKSLTSTKGQSAIVKTVSATDIKANLSNKGGKRAMNFSAKSPGINRGNMVTLNSRLLIRPHDLSLHPNSNLPPNAAKQAANQVRRQFQISGSRRIPSTNIVKQNTEPPTPLKNPSLIYNELGLSNLTVGATDGENKSKNDEEKRLLRHVDSVIETIMDETRLSEGEGEISKLLKGQSAAGEETALEFPDGETPPDALNLVESSEKENEEKSKSPVRFIKSSDGTIKISSVSHSSRNLPQQPQRIIAIKPKGPLLIRRELGAQGPILIRKGLDNIEKKNDTDKESEEVVTIDSTPTKETVNEIRLETPSHTSSISKHMGFSNRVIMNQLENPRELANLPNLTSLPKYQLETASKMPGGNLVTNADTEISGLELEAKRHQQIHMLIKLARLWMNKANDLEVVNARLSAGWKDAGLNPGFLEVASDKALVYWRHKAMTLNSENLTLKKELVAFIRSKGDINDETAKRYRTENSNLRAKLAARERQASVVGLMRNGALLAEENPMKLMESYNLTSLEDVFLKLCMRKGNQASSVNGTLDRRSNQNGTLSRVCRSLVQNGLNNIGGNDTLTKYQGQLVYPGMTATLDDHSIQPISYSRRNIDKSTSMKMNWTQAASYKRQSTNQHFSSDEESSTCCCCPCMGRIWALVIKNVIKMKRNLSTLFFAFMLPAVQICFFCVAIGQKPSNLPFGVVNQEAHPFGSVCDFNDGCEFKNFSCRYLSTLYDDPTLNLLQYKDMESAVKAVEDGTIWGTIHIGRNFTPALVKTVLDGIKADKDSRDQSQVEVRLDMSNQQIVVAIQQTLVDGFKKFSSDFMNDCGKILGREGESSEDILPVIFGEPVYGETDPVFVDFMIPGTIVLIIFFLAIGLTGEAFIQERKDGLLHRSWVAGVLPAEIVFAQIATQIFVLVGQTAVALLMTLVVFGISCEGSIGIVVVVTLLQGIAGMCYGFLLSTLFKEESTAMQAGVGSFYPLMMLSGILWPIEGMPTFLRKLSIYLPCTAATQSMRDVMTRGWGLEKPSVYLGLVSSSVWIAIFLISSWLVIRFTKW